jgi:hypothetical protein
VKMAELGAHFAEAASRSGLGLDAALSLRAQLVGVSGVSEKRAVELLLMAGACVLGPT